LQYSAEFHTLNISTHNETLLNSQQSYHFLPKTG